MLFLTNACNLCICHYYCTKLCKMRFTVIPSLLRVTKNPTHIKDRTGRAQKVSGHSSEDGNTKWNSGTKCIVRPLLQNLSENHWKYMESTIQPKEGKEILDCATNFHTQIQTIAMFQAVATCSVVRTKQLCGQTNCLNFRAAHIRSMRSRTGNVMCSTAKIKFLQTYLLLRTV
jgi:hypothetical protein